MSTTVVDRLRRPEYTGENRCVPCTIANTVIAAGLAVAVGAGGVAVAGLATTVAAGAGVAVFAASAAAIYLRGYLVPYTPTLTKRYFPEWLLAAFDKAEPAGVDTEEPGEPDLDPESVLLSAGAVETCAREDDLCLTEAFESDWTARVEATDAETVDTDDIVAALNMELSAASLSRFGDAVVLESEGRQVGKWESEAALVADVTAAATLEERFPGWTDLGPADRSRILRGLRVFLEGCPLCSGPVAMGQETVESCCRSFDVVAVSCEDCAARLFEQRWDGA